MLERFHAMSSQIQGVPSDMSEIRRDLREKTKGKGAYFCSLPSFIDKMCIRDSHGNRAKRKKTPDGPERRKGTDGRDQAVHRKAGALQYILCSGSCRTDDRRRGDKRFNRDETEDRQKIKCYCSLRAQQHASRCTDMEHSAPYRAGCLGILLRKTPPGTLAVNSNKKMTDTL